MSRRRLHRSALMMGIGLAISLPGFADDIEALYRGQAIMLSAMGDYPAAAALLQQGTPRQSRRAPETEWLLGEIYRDYGMHRNAERVFRQIIARGVTSAQRSQAWIGLAQMRYQRGQLDSAEDALAYVAQDLPREQAIERLRMQASVMLDKGHATRVVRLLEAADVRTLADPYLDFNFAIALNAAGQEAKAAEVLQGLGQASASSEEWKAVRDRANLALAMLMANRNDDKAALVALERIRRDGPYVVERLQMQALARERQGQWLAALADWQTLRRESAREVVPEATWLRAAHAAEQAGDELAAAQLYREAIQDYARETATLQQALTSLEQTTWTDLLSEAPSAAQAGREWMRYLPALMASHAFRSALNDYRDAYQLDQKLRLLRLRVGDSRLALEARKQQLPAALQAHDMATTESRLRSLQRAATRLEPQLGRQGDARVSANASESQRAMMERLAMAEVRLRTLSDESVRQPLQQRLTLLRGMLLWDTAQSAVAGRERQQTQWKTISSGIAAAADTRQRLIASQEGLSRAMMAGEDRLSAMPARLNDVERGLAEVMLQRRGLLTRLAQEQLQQRLTGLRLNQDRARYAMARLQDKQATRSELPR